MNQLSLPFLEIMIIRACNLSCQGCTTFSDLTHTGYVNWQQGQQWLVPWAKKINIEAVGLMGGEPLINPQLADWLIGIRTLLPDAQIRFVTNGLLLDRHWHIVELLQQLGNTVLKISHHIDDARITNVIDRIFSTWQWTPVEEFGISRWQRADNLRFQIARPLRFIKTFRGDYPDIMPHANTPADAFRICVQQRCPLLYKGNLFKCGTLGLTPDLLERFNWPNQELWQPYMTPGLSPESDPSLVEEFVKNFGRPHTVCAQCPSDSDLTSMVDHTKTVTFKKIKHV